MTVPTGATLVPAKMSVTVAVHVLSVLIGTEPGAHDTDVDVSLDR